MNNNWLRHSSCPAGLCSVLIALFALMLVLPLAPQAMADGGEAAGKIVNPGAELWREVRDATKGTTQVEGVDSGVLVSDAGDRWRQYRMQQLAPYGAMVLGGMVGIFVLYYLIRGKIRVEAGRSGSVVRRYTTSEMVVHWFLAITFVILALSGLILLFGRWVLIPLLGPEAFSIIAVVSKNLHNYVGLLFSATIPIAFFLYLKDSLFNFKVDGKWFMRLGGYLGGEEPSAEKVNAGQKSWYWVAMLGGLVLIASGLFLDFPNFQQSREWLQLAHIIHTIAAVAVMAFFVVHLYLATVGVEGALESMVNGHVDANWAKQHHDLWYEQVKDTAIDAQTLKSGGGGSAIGEQKAADA
jgi:formate dehydrogenase subunit gamma